MLLLIFNIQGRTHVVVVKALAQPKEILRGQSLRSTVPPPTPRPQKFSFFQFFLFFGGGGEQKKIYVGGINFVRCLREMFPWPRFTPSPPTPSPRDKILCTPMITYIALSCKKNFNVIMFENKLFIIYV